MFSRKSTAAYQHSEMELNFENEVDRRGIELLVEALENDGKTSARTWARRNQLEWAERRGFVKKVDRQWCLTPKGRASAELFRSLKHGKE